MPLCDQATSRADLRAKIVAMLKATIPASNLSSDDPRFFAMTGLTSTTLRKDWKDRGPNEPGQTSCNSFAGWVAQQIGFKAGTTMFAGKMDLSNVENEVAGSWIWANTGEAIEAKLCPQPGDFFCQSRPGQMFAHVGIVVEIDANTTWRWLAGGQGGKATSPDDINKAVDYIKWGPWLPTHPRSFNQARPNVAGWVDVGAYFFPDEE